MSISTERSRRGGLTAAAGFTVRRGARSVARPSRPREWPLLPRELRAGWDRPGADHPGAGHERGLGDRAECPARGTDRSALRRARGRVRRRVEAGDAPAARAGAVGLAL